MTSPARKGIVLAVVHVAIVASLGAKLLLDRSTYPRVWARAAPVDPDLPIRGRYVSLRLEAAIGPGLDLPAESDREAGGVGRRPSLNPRPVTLAAVDGQLVARPAPEAMFGLPLARARLRDGVAVAELLTPVAYFIPEDVPDPSIRPPGEELWVEVTLPPAGAPRPIRLGVRRDGVLTPLTLR
jgi:hypothetical protein